MHKDGNGMRTGAIMAASMGVSALCVGLLGAVGRPGPAFAVAGSAPMTAPALVEAAHDVVPGYLSTIYEAFGETEEGAIYDRLARAAGDKALVTLYLERMGAVTGPDYEPDQQVFEMEILDLAAREAQGAVAMEARWHVMGVVGHEGHSHVRDNTYAARMTLSPVDGAWKITRFDLTDADRVTGAGS
jgi:hypothetical protein